MRPGRFSQGGFLGLDESLDVVQARDAQTLVQIKVTYEELATALEGLIKVADLAPGRPMRIDHHWEARVVSYRGSQMCPWASDPHHEPCSIGKGARYASVDWNIRNLRTGQEMRGPGLIVHLIGDHHFFEGFESPYRVDPAELARLLERGMSSH